MYKEKQAVSSCTKDIIFSNVLISTFLIKILMSAYGILTSLFLPVT